MKSLDEDQQRYLERLRKGGAIQNRRGAFAYGFMIGGGVVGGTIGGLSFAGDLPWLYAVGVAEVLALGSGAVAAWIGPDPILRYLVRSQLPPKESLAGLSGAHSSAAVLVL